MSPWATVINHLLPSLISSAWQIRHGGAQALLELLRANASVRADTALGVARQLLILLALDRFGDFDGDTVVAPVRETSAQALGLALKNLSGEGVAEVHSTLMAMVRQSWAKRGRDGDGVEKWQRFAWELRHAGLLGLKYEVAVRSDLLEAGKTEPTVKGEQGKLNVLRDVVDAGVLA